jgi:hypothetical protein
MSYENKMYLRMFLPCVFATAAASALAWLAAKLPSLPAGPVVPTLWPDLPNLIALAAVLMCMAVCGIQAFRLWRWQNGAVDDRLEN